VAAVAAAWLLLLITAPFLTTPVAGVLYAGGALICHQLPDRSFHLQGIQLPVCARCVGLYGGAAVGSAIAAGFARRWLERRSLMLTQSVKLVATGVAAVPTLATFALEWGFGWPISNAVRAIAALPFGFAVALVVVSALATVHSTGAYQLEEYPQQPASTPSGRPRQRRGRS
jgi:uncharacterized membrane protein